MWQLLGNANPSREAASSAPKPSRFFGNAALAPKPEGAPKSSGVLMDAIREAAERTAAAQPFAKRLCGIYQVGDLFKHGGTGPSSNFVAGAPWNIQTHLPYPKD